MSDLRVLHVVILLVLLFITLSFGDNSWSPNKNLCTRIEGNIERCVLKNVNVLRRSIFMSKTEYNGTDFAQSYKSVEFIDSKLSLLPRNLFQFFERAKKLSVIQAGLLDIDQSDFVNGDGLHIIEITGNKLKSIRKQTFLYSPWIVHLDLSSNLIENVKYDALYGLKKLEYVNLSNNRIKHIWEGTFLSSTKLSYLFLDHNRIWYFDNNTFASGTYLKNFTLNNNLLVTLATTALPQAFTIDASYNKLEQIYGSENMRLEKFDVSNNNLKEYIVNPKVSSLDLSNNGNTVNLTFSNPKLIRTLILKNATLLNMNFTNNLENLGYLDLSYNNLKIFNWTLFEKSGKLSYLSIDGNKFKELQFEEIVTVFPQLTKIGISNNQWNSTYIEEIYKFMKNHHPLMPSICEIGETLESCIDKIDRIQVPKPKTEFELLTEMVQSMRLEMNALRDDVGKLKMKIK